MSIWNRERREEVRARLYEAQNHCCGLCGFWLFPDYSDHPTEGWTLEHVRPRCRHDLANTGNIVLAHNRCNNRKHDRDPTGCELIWLDSVNVRMGWSPHPKRGGVRITGMQQAAA